MARFDATPDLDTTFHFDTDPDPDPTHSCWKKRNLFLTFFHSKASLHCFFCQPRRRLLEEKYSLALHLPKMDTDPAK
jgi:hypothetical protein